MKMLLRSGHAKPPLPVVSSVHITTSLLRRKLQFGGSLKINCSLSSKNDKELMKLDGGGPPRWFSPLECGCSSTTSPLLLFLPGTDGVGLGLMLHHKRLGEIFEVWCLHIPAADRTPLAELVTLVQSTVQTEHNRAPKRPIYLVGESFGASLALVVAANNPDIDLVLILANPATNFSKSLAQSVMRLMDKLRNILNPALWKLKMIDEMQNYLNSHIHAVKAQSLIFFSGKILLLFSGLGEGKKLRTMLDRCWIRSYIGCRNPLFLDDTFDLVIGIQRECYYRRGPSVNYVSDYLPPSPSEFKIAYRSLTRCVDVGVDPVMFSTVGGKVVRGLEGIPSEGPVILVGCHMLYGIDAVPIFLRFLIERNIIARSIAHPLNFGRLRKDGKILSLSMFDIVRISGGVPASITNFYRLLSQKSHVLLYPGGVREALHRKGEEYKLIWPDEPEFVRMAARFGAKIIPFGAVGEDDVLQLLLDYDEQMKIPPLKAIIEELTKEAASMRGNVEGEVGKQILHYPIVLPKLPGRFYYLFGEPISTQGREDVLRNKDKAREMYVQVKTEIEKSIAYLKEKREKDPYRNFLARLVYQARHGFDSQVPTFDI